MAKHIFRENGDDPYRTRVCKYCQEFYVTKAKSGITCLPCRVINLVNGLKGLYPNDKMDHFISIIKSERGYTNGR